jgi:hypothetical protein
MRVVYRIKTTRPAGAAFWRTRSALRVSSSAGRSDRGWTLGRSAATFGCAID